MICLAYLMYLCSCWLVYTGVRASDFFWWTFTMWWARL